MNEEQIEVVKATWGLVSPMRDKLATSFYTRLFERDDDLVALFPEDMTEQKAKFTQMLGKLVEALDHFDDMVPSLRELGRRHVAYGATETRYRKVGAALLYALEDTLGPQWDPEARDGWAALYNLLYRVMITAARETDVA